MFNFRFMLFSGARARFGTDDDIDATETNEIELV